MAVEMFSKSYQQFIRSIFVLGIPIALQNLLFSSAGFVDTFIMSQLGTESVVASSIGARVFWFASTFVWGMGTGLGVLIAQFWGANDQQGLKQNYAIGHTFALIATLPIFVVCFAFSDIIPRWFNTSGVTAQLTADYLQLISFGILLSAPAIAMDAALRALGKTKITLYLTVLGMVLNVFFSVIFVFGYFGFPSMGLKGAALGTVISRLFAVIASYGYIRLFVSGLTLQTTDFRFGFADVSRYLSVTLPVILGSLIWSGGFLMYQILIGQMGEMELAVMAVIGAIFPIALSFASGLSGAVAIIVGHELGASDFQKAENTRVMQFIRHC